MIKIEDLKPGTIWKHRLSGKKLMVIENRTRIEYFQTFGDIKIEVLRVRDENMQVYDVEPFELEDVISGSPSRPWEK